MPHHIRVPGKVAVSNRDHVAITLDHDAFPPSAFKRLFHDDKMAGSNLVPGPWTVVYRRVGVSSLQSPIPVSRSGVMFVE
jgi:hypothetical protein